MNAAGRVVEKVAVRFEPALEIDQQSYHQQGSLPLMGTGTQCAPFAACWLNIFYRCLREKVKL